MNVGAIRNTDFAKTVLAGEYIQHYCPPKRFRYGEHPRNIDNYGKIGVLSSLNFWRYPPYIIFSVLVVSLVVCLVCCICDAWRAEPARKLNTFQFSESELED